MYEEQHGLPILEAEDFAAENENGTHLLTTSDELRAEVMGGKKIDMHGVPVHSAVTGVHPLGSGSDYTVFLQRIGVASANGGFGSTLSDPVYHYHSVFDSQTWQERFGDPGFHRHVSYIPTINEYILIRFPIVRSLWRNISVCSSSV